MRKKVACGVGAVLALGLLSGLLTSLVSPGAGMGLAWTPLGSDTATAAPASPLGVAAQVTAFYQGDPSAGWDSPQQYATWWPSACAPAALTMVLRAWGAPLAIGQVLDRLIVHQAITPAQGLLHAEALEQVAKDAGFHARTFWRWNEQQLDAVTAQGVPVLIDVVDAHRQTPYPGFVVGHWLVVVRIAADHVDVRDSSGYHLHSLETSVFHTLFTGLGVVVWQGASPNLPQ